MSDCVLHVYSACRSLREGIGSSETGITDGHEPPRACWELNSGPVEEQPEFITVESLLQSFSVYFEAGSHCVALGWPEPCSLDQVGLKFTGIQLPPPPECWEQRFFFFRSFLFLTQSPMGKSWAFGFWSSHLHLPSPGTTDLYPQVNLSICLLE